MHIELPADARPGFDSYNRSGRAGGQCADRAPIWQGWIMYLLPTCKVRSAEGAPLPMQVSATE